MSISMRDHSVEEIVAYILDKRDNPDPVEEAAERQRLKQRIADYEREFGFPSREIHERIDNKTLKEDERVCDWLMTIAMLPDDGDEE